MAISETADLLIRLNAQNNAMAAFGKLSSQLDGIGSTVMKVAGLIGSAFALRDVINTTQQWGQQLDVLHDILGLTGAEAARWNFQARVVGITADELSTGFGMLSKKIFDSGQAILRGTSDFDKFGIKVLDTNDNLLSNEQILDNVREAMAKMGAQEQIAFEKSVFGKAGGRLHDFFTLSAEGLREMDQAFRELDLPTNTDEMEAMQRQANFLGLVFDSIKIRLGNALLPVLLSLGRGLSQVAGLAKVLGEALRSPLTIIKEVIDRFGTFLTQIKDQGLVIGITNLAKDIVSKIGETLGNVASWVADNWPKWKEALGTLWNKIVDFVETNAPRFADWIVNSIPTWSANLAQLSGSVVGWVISDLIPGFVDAMFTIIPKLYTWAVGVGNWLATKGLPAMLGAAQTVGEGIAGAIGDAIGPALRRLVETIRIHIMPNITLDGIIWNTVFDLLGSFKDWLIQHLGDGFNIRIPLPFGPGTPPSPAQPGSGFIGAPTNQKVFGGQLDRLVEGGIVLPRPGGTPVLIGEGGHSEAVIPLDRTGSMGTTIIVNVSGNITRSEQELASIVSREIMRNIGSRRAVAF